MFLTRYFWISSDPQTLRNVADVWLATAFARRVFPANSIHLDDQQSTPTDLRHLHTSSWSSIKDDTFRRFYSHFFIVFRMS